MNKVLILLPDSNDLHESSKLNIKQYEVHTLHASEEVAGKEMTFFKYQKFLAQPEFLTSYVDRAVSYVKEHGITAIMYGHDLSSVVASVVCERTGLRGPTLESTFRSLHKYYTRVTEKTPDMWFDFINLDHPAEYWKNKVRYPCFLKAPFLTSSEGLSTIRSETEMVKELARLEALVTPFYIGYSHFFKKYLDLEKFPLAVQNIVLVEDLILGGREYAVDGWVDDTGSFSMYCIIDKFLSQYQEDIITLANVFPQFTLEKPTVEKVTKFTKDIIKRFGLRESFFGIEIWKLGDKLILVEVNARLTIAFSEGYKKLFGVSNYQSAIYLACGEMEKLMEHSAPNTYQCGNMISGYFSVPTLTEGKAIEFIDYKYARTGCIMDGVYNNAGPGMNLYVEEDSFVKQTSLNGVKLCSFMISETNLTNLFQRAKNIMKKLVLRPEDLALTRFEIK